MPNKSQVAQIKKRDGRVMSFDENKIISAIFKALRVTGKEDYSVAEKLAGKVFKALNKKFDGHTVPSVEQIQDMVEEVLVKENLVEAAKAYILYRDQHARIRDINKFIDSDDLVNQYLNKLDWRVKENSNMAYSLQGLNNHIASTISAHYWLNAIYSPEIRQAHMEGDLHIHDLQLLAAYCCGWDVKDLLVHGFKGVEGKVQSKPPKHFRSALGMVVNFLYTLQGEANGAQAFSSFDTYLAPFIRYDKLSYKQVKQGVQEFMFNMNIPTRVGFQCMSEDTEILAEDGWKKHNQVKKGDTIATFNMDKGFIEYLPVKKVFARDYKGVMYHLNNKETDQLISPKHRIVRKDSNKYTLEEIEKLLDLDISVPVLKDIKDIEDIKDISVAHDEIKEVDYKGIIWCPNTDNETVVARRNGKIFITGNTPFTNITMDLKPSGELAEDNIIIGGEVKKEKYKDFQEEMDMFNRAYAEVNLEGDAKGRVFTFPIPTYNITKDLDWDNERLDPVWEMTAKYGIPYFSNYINSDMSPDDARSMCPLAGNEKILAKSSRGRAVEYSSIRGIYEGHRKVKSEEYEIYSDGKFIKGKFNKFSNQKMIKVVLDNGHEIKMSESHLNFIKKEKGSKEQVLPGRKLEKDMYLPYSLNKYDGEGGNEDLGFFVGAYAGDGCFNGEATVNFSLEGEFKKDLIGKLEKIASEYFGAHSVVIKDKRTKLVSLRVHSKAAVGLCQDFVADKEREKHYQARLFVASEEFRQGVIAGHYAADGGNRHRIYTSSPKMVETLNMLAATLGTTTSIYRDDREGRLGTEPNYAVLIYQLNRKNYGKIWFKEKDRLWVKIKEIKKIPGDTAYCFEVKKGKPVFTVGTTGILTHNCRLRLDNRELRKRGGGLFGANPLTGSIGVVTINLPRVGYLAKTEEDFFKRLDTLMEISRESLETKREVIEKFSNMGLYPYSRFYLQGIKDQFGEYWKNHFNTIGLLGMNEALLNYMGKDLTSEEGHKFAEKILDHMRERMGEYQEETNHLYNLEATPGEGTTYRFAKADKRKYADIIVANEKAYKEKDAAPYYTNSSQLPVGFTDDIFSALDLQDDLQAKYTGGTVLHGFLGEKMPSIKATKDLVKKIAENYTLPYYTLTPTFSVCPKHGYLAGEHRWCPKCDEEIGYTEEAVSAKTDLNQEKLFKE